MELFGGSRELGLVQEAALKSARTLVQRNTGERIGDPLFVFPVNVGLQNNFTFDGWCFLFSTHLWVVNQQAGRKVIFADFFAGSRFGEALNKPTARAEFIFDFAATSGDISANLSISPKLRSDAVCLNRVAKGQLASK